MPKVLIMSDSHGLTKEVEDIKQRHQSEVDMMIHCGDSELAYGSKELEGFAYAKGNCDFEPEMVNEQIITIGGLSILAVHGHLHQIKSSLMPLYYRAEEVGAQVACFGHSHVAGAEKVEDKLFINPGSARLPRDHKKPSYAILQWESLKSIQLQYFHVNGEAMEGMKLETSFAARD